MTFHTVCDVDDALRSGGAISTRDLYTIWNQRLRVPIAAKKEASTFEASARPLEWLQDDLETVTAFTEQALSRQEYMLVCDVYDEAKTYWAQGTRPNTPGWIKQMAKLANHCATAKTRLGFTRSARNILEPIARNPNLGRRERARLLVELGEIVREESHHAPDRSSRRVSGENALALYQEALILDPELLNALVLSAAMQFVICENSSVRLEQAQASARQVMLRIEDVETGTGA